jgi:hypothetical protein
MNMEYKIEIENVESIHYYDTDTVNQDVSLICHNTYPEHGPYMVKLSKDLFAIFEELYPTEIIRAKITLDFGDFRVRAEIPLTNVSCGEKNIKFIELMRIKGWKFVVRDPITGKRIDKPTDKEIYYG